MEEVPRSDTFNNAFLTALSKWQNGWHEDQERRQKLAAELVIQCEGLSIEFKTVDVSCYRKRFIIEGEIIPILLKDYLLEGIASWSTNLDYVKNFKGFVKPSTKFAVVFKHAPRQNEIIVNIPSLWTNDKFISAAKEFKNKNPKEAEALFNFKDDQSEIVLKSTLKGSEIEDIVGVSSSFEVLCDLARIPEGDREALSIKYARAPNGIPIELPVFAGPRASKEAVRNTISKMTNLLNYARENNIPIVWGKSKS